MKRWLLFLNLWLLASANIQLDGPPFLQIFEAVDPATGNLTQWQNRQAKFTCDQDNFEEWNLKIGDKYWHIQCPAPIETDNVVLRGFVPREAHLYTTTIFLVDSISRINGNASGSDFVFNENPASRRLLGFDLLDTLFSGAEDYACLVTLHLAGMLPGVDCDGRGGGGPDANVDQKWKQLNNRISDLVQIQQTFSNQTLLALNGQVKINQDVFNQLLLKQQQINALKSATAATDNALEKLAEHQDQVDAEIVDAIKDTKGEIAQSLQLATSYSDAQLKEFAGNIGNALNNTVNSHNQLRDAVKHDRTLMYRKVHDVARDLRKLAGANVKERTNELTNRQMSFNVWKNLDKAVEDGYVPYLDPASPGIRPQTLLPTGASNTIFIDRVRFNWVNTTGGLNYAHSLQVKFYCNARRILDQLIKDVYWHDMWDLLGPVNCTKGPGAAVDQCLCWIDSIDHKQCQVSSGFTWQAITSENRADYQVLPAYCSVGSPTTVTHLGISMWHGQYIDDIKRFHSLLGSIACPGATLGGAVTGIKGGTQFQVVSERIGVFNLDPDYRSAVCSVDVDVIMEGLGDDPTAPTSLPVTWYTNWVTAANIMFNDVRTIEIQLYGSMPNRITCTNLPFNTLPDGRHYQGWRCSFIAVTADTIPVWEVQTGTISTVVTATAYATPPICNNLGCTPSGPALSTQHQATATTTLTFQQSFPQTGDVILDELKFSGLNHAYDFQRGDAPLCTPPQCREGHLTYLLQDVPNSFVMPVGNSPVWPATTFIDKWLLKNGDQIFNHEQASYSPSIVRETVVSGQTTSSVKQWVGEFLRRAQIRSGNNFRTGVFQWSPDAYTISVVLDINDGIIVLRDQPGCPAVDFISYTDGSALLTLTNSLPQEITVFRSIDTVEDSSCPPGGFKQITMQPKDVYKERLTRCGQQQIRVERQEIGGGRTACIAPKNITFNPLSPINVSPFVEDGNITVFVDDSISIGFAAVASDLGDFLRNDFMPFFTSEVLKINLTQTQNNKLNDLIDDFINKTKTSADNLDVIKNNKAVQAIADDLAKARSDLSRVDALSELVNEGMQQLNESLIEEKQIVADLANTVQDQKVATDLVVDGVKELNDAIDNRQKDGDDGTCGNWLIKDCLVPRWFCGLFCGFIKLVEILLLVAVFVGVVYGAWRLFKYCRAQRAAEDAKKRALGATTSGGFRRQRRGGGYRTVSQNS